MSNTTKKTLYTKMTWKDGTIINEQHAQKSITKYNGSFIRVPNI